MTRLHRIISISFGIACFALAVAVQRKPTAGARQVDSPSANILLSDSLPTDDEELLARPVPSLDFDNAPLGAVAARLSDLDSVNIVIDWESLHHLQVPGNVAVTVHLKDATLADAMRAIVGSLAAHGHHGIDFAVDYLSIMLWESGTVHGSTHIKYFNIRALIDHLSADAHLAAADRAMILDQLADTVSHAVDFASWRDNGGNIGSVRELGGVLVVSQTGENLVSIGLLLDAIDRARSTGGTAPLMVGKNIAVFNVPSLLVGLTTRDPDAPGREPLRTYIMNHVARTKWDAGIASADIGAVAGVVVIRGQKNIVETQQALEELSRELPSNQKR